MSIVDFDSGTWADPWFQGLTQTAKMLFIYLFTNDHKNVSGVYPLSLKTMQNESGIELQEIENTLPILYPKVQYDTEHQIVMILNHVKRQFLRGGTISPKIIIAIRKNLLQLPEKHKFIPIFLKRYNYLKIFTSDIPYPYPMPGVSCEGTCESEGGGEGKEKHKHGEYKHVLLTDEQFRKLNDKFGQRAAHWITTLDEGIQQKGYKYNDHYLTILKWAKKDGDNGKSIEMTGNGELSVQQKIQKTAKHREEHPELYERA